MHRPLHAYLHAQTHGPRSLLRWELQQEPAQIPNMQRGAAARVSAGVTRHVSHSIPPAGGQVTLREARSGPKTATRHPAERAAHQRQRPASFTHPVTPQQCVGGREGFFLRNGRVEPESKRDLIGICAG